MKLDALSNSIPAISTVSLFHTRQPAQVEPPAVVEEQQPLVEVDDVQVQRAAEVIDQKINAIAPNLRFSVDSDTGKTVVKVVDISTGETIRQMPSEEVLAISRSIHRLQGLLLNGEG